MIGLGHRARASGPARSTSAPRASSTPARSRRPGSGCTSAGLAAPARDRRACCWPRRSRPGRSGWLVPVLLRAALRRARGDQHAAAQLRGRGAGQPDGAGAAAGGQRHLSAERSDRGGGPAPAAAGHPAARGTRCSRWSRRRRSGTSSRARSGDSGCAPSGAGPRAAEISGRIDARRMVAVALLGSGALAGLAGGVEVSGVSYALFQNLSPGYGFTAIAVALLARLHPLGVVATGHAVRRARGRGGRHAAGRRGAGGGGVRGRGGDHHRGAAGRGVGAARRRLPGWRRDGR